MPGRSVSTSRSSRASTSGNSPTEVALTTTSVVLGHAVGPAPGDELRLGGRALVEQRDELGAALRVAVDDRDRPGPRERGLDRDRPRRAARAEHHERRLPAGSTTVRSDSMKPWPSVFSPISRPSRRTTQLTAPITAADSRQRRRGAR